MGDVAAPQPIQDTPEIALITGGTGLLGSHIAERLARAGTPIRALVRPGGDARFLQSLGAEILHGNLTDPASCERAAAGVAVVYHAASKVGDWGPWRDFQTDCLQATSILGLAAARARVRRLVHISSTSAYGHPPEGGPPVVESDPLGQRLWPAWDYYTRSKVEQERILWDLAAREGLELTVIRPSWLYGERDRTTTARLVARLRSQGIPTIGPGDNPLSAIYAGEVAAAAILAASLPHARGEAYNVTDLGPISQREFFSIWAAACGAQPSSRNLPYALVFAAAFALEAASRLTRRRRPPVTTRYATWLMARDVFYSTDKARDHLGWNPAEGYEATIRRTVDWYQQAAASPRE